MERERTALQELRDGWKLILACFTGFSYFSLMTASLGVFIVPLTQEFGWSRTLVSSGVSLASFAVAIFSPFIGIVVDRYGSRKVALPGIWATAVGISSFALLNGSPTQWLLIWAFYATISVTVKTTVWTASLVRTFNKSQGLAMGLVLSGTAVAHTIAPLLTTWLIENTGWRDTYIWLGVGWGILTFLVCYWFLNDGGAVKSPLKQEGMVETPTLSGISVEGALKSSALWKIGTSSCIMMIFTIGLLIHQIPILIESGASTKQAALLASMAGAMGVVGKLVSGVLLDRFRPNWVGGITLGSTALAFVLLIDGVRTQNIIILAMLINGYSAGSKLQISSYLTARYAGARNFGLIYGVIISCVTFGSGLGPMVAGMIYDAFNGYSIFLIAGAFACLFCGGLIYSLPDYPKWNEPEPATA